MKYTEIDLIENIIKTSESREKTEYFISITPVVEE